MPRIALTPRQYIGRIPRPDGRTAGWQVRATRFFNGSRYFSASKYGGVRVALAKAQKWRDGMVRGSRKAR